MTAETLAERCARELRSRADTIDRLRTQIRWLREDNLRMRAARENLKVRNSNRVRENERLRRRVVLLRKSRDMWRTRARKRGEKLYNYRRNGAAPWHNVTLSERDLKRILEIPVR